MEEIGGDLYKTLWSGWKIGMYKKQEFRKQKNIIMAYKNIREQLRISLSLLINTMEILREHFGISKGY